MFTLLKSRRVLGWVLVILLLASVATSALAVAGSAWRGIYASCSSGAYVTVSTNTTVVATFHMFDGSTRTVISPYAGTYNIVYGAGGDYNGVTVSGNNWNWIGNAGCN